jgi:hypothetical protein
MDHKQRHRRLRERGICPVPLKKKPYILRGTDINSVYNLKESYDE